jgi:hypothetical protein
MKSYLPYRKYVTHLHALINIAYADSEAIHNEDFLGAVNAALDGEASQELRKRVDLEHLRQDGVFFTCAQLADSALANVGQTSVYFDPSCGAGNLLVACAKKLPIEETLEETLKCWGKQLIGRDIHPEFVEATRARIALTALQRGVRAYHQKFSLGNLLPKIKVGDCLVDESVYAGCSQLVTNPPFTMVRAPAGCKWASGLINSAALFLETAISHVQEKTRITAILPEVLRTGSRYAKWRECISSKVSITSIKSFGLFDKKVDVDVFVLDCIKSEAQSARVIWWSFNGIASNETISKYFDVYVGPVVPHRHPCSGPLLPYIHAKNISSWKQINPGAEERRFNGTVFKPPFVVIRRTSRPTDKYRSIGSIVTGTQHVAVENHLIICKPKSCKLSDCRQLLSLLHSELASNWLNERIRCRHLTVSSIKELPWSEVKND